MHFFGQGTDNKQPESGTLLFLTVVSPVEFVENKGNILIRDPFSVIPEGNLYLFFLLDDKNVNGRAGIFSGIDNNIFKNLDQTVIVGMNRKGEIRFGKADTCSLQYGILS